MLNFYYQATRFKTPRNTKNESPQIISKAESLSKNTTMCNKQKANGAKMQKAKQNLFTQPCLPQQLSSAKIQEGQQRELKLHIFKNSAIKQKLRDIQSWKAEQRIKNKLTRQKVEMKQYQASVHHYLVKKIKQNIQKSEYQKLCLNRDTALANAQAHKSSVRRYRTLNQQNTARKSKDYINTITQNVCNRADKMQTSIKRERKLYSKHSSNLIFQDQSLLAHIIRKQKEFQEKSLKIIAIRNRNSVRCHSKQSQQNPMAKNTEKWNSIKPFNNSTTKNRKSQSISNYKAQYVLKNDIKFTQSLIQPWEI